MQLFSFQTQVLRMSLAPLSFLHFSEICWIFSCLFCSLQEFIFLSSLSRYHDFQTFPLASFSGCGPFLGERGWWWRLSSAAIDWRMVTVNSLVGLLWCYFVGELIKLWQKHQRVRLLHRTGWSQGSWVITISQIKSQHLLLPKTLKSQWLECGNSPFCSIPPQPWVSTAWNSPHPKHGPFLTASTLMPPRLEVYWDCYNSPGGDVVVKSWGCWSLQSGELGVKRDHSSLCGWSQGSC